MTPEQHEHKKRVDRERKKQRRLEWLEANGPCVDCGEKDVSVLQVDHVDPREKVTHRVWSWRKERREAELSKCVPRCMGCHVAKTFRDLKQHGEKGNERMAEVLKRERRGY